MGFLSFLWDSVLTFSMFQIRSKSPQVPELFTYAPNKRFKYSEHHDLYTRDLKIMRDIPPPRPPVRKKSDIIDVSEYLMVDDRAIRVSCPPQKRQMLLPIDSNCVKNSAPQFIITLFNQFMPTIP